MQPGSLLTFCVLLPPLKPQFSHLVEVGIMVPILISTSVLWYFLCPYTELVVALLLHMKPQLKNSPSTPQSSLCLPAAHCSCRDVLFPANSSGSTLIHFYQLAVAENLLQLPYPAQIEFPEKSFYFLESPSQSTTNQNGVPSAWSPEIILLSLINTSSQVLTLLHYFNTLPHFFDQSAALLSKLCPVYNSYLTLMLPA